jgi:hypothetical protein
VCLVESQYRRTNGRFGGNCCVPFQANLLDYPGAGNYDTWGNAWKAAFQACADGTGKVGPSANWASPTIYTVANFRNARDIGAIDMDDSYNRNAGYDALGGLSPADPSPDPYAPCCELKPADCVENIEGDIIPRTVDADCSDDNEACIYGDLP